MKPPDADLLRILDTGPPAGTRWRHRAGGEYLVLTCGLVEATLDVVVVYQNANGVVWTRPLAEFADGRFTRLDS